MIKKVSHILLATILLTATVGLTINLHYCTGDLYSIGIDSQADNCCKDEGPMSHTTDMDHEAVCSTNGNDTDNCDDETTIVRISDFFTKTIQNVSFNNSNVISLFNTLLQNDIKFFSFNEEETDFDNSNDSPPNTRQILSLKESFLL